MTNAEKFLSDYIAIERYLRRVYGSQGQFETFLQLVTKAEKQHSIIRHYAADLREYGELRNAIIHNRAPEDNAIIAEPHSFVVERLAHIRKMIEDPIKVASVMTAPVFTVTQDALLYDTAKIMLNKLYTHVPVYKDDVFMGILSESAILKWVGNRAKDNKQLKSDRKIDEIIDWLDTSGNKYNDYEFIPRSMVVLDVRKRFEVALSEGRRLGAIFVTKSGKSSEKIEGIVTAWDLPQLQLD